MHLQRYLPLLLSPLVSAATMQQWLQTYSTTPYSDVNTPRPMTFSTASRIYQENMSKNLNNGTLFVASDDVYETAGATTGGISFMRVLIDYTRNVARPGDPDAGLFHFDYFADTDFNVSMIWDDYAPGRNLTPTQVWGRDRKIYIQTGNEVESNSCFLTLAVFCDDGLIQVTNCLVNPSPEFGATLQNQKSRLALDFGEWVKVVERAGMTETLNALPFNSVTMFVPTDQNHISLSCPPKCVNRNPPKNHCLQHWFGAYSSDNHPVDAATALSGLRRTMGPDTLAGTAADIIFRGGIIRGVNQVAVPSTGLEAAVITGLPTPATGSATVTLSGQGGRRLERLERQRRLRGLGLVGRRDVEGWDGGEFWLRWGLRWLGALLLEFKKAGNAIIDI
ncbi:hypothetical protein BC829DRAFT_419145 [Chytridium lagenaria]|nr:hypothetical protein BC829DRAFT_419145 [Chytridium lagenaria]